MEKKWIPLEGPGNTLLSVGVDSRHFLDRPVAFYTSDFAQHCIDLALCLIEALSLLRNNGLTNQECILRKVLSSEMTPRSVA